VNADPVPRRLAFVARGMAFIRTDEALQLPEDDGRGLRRLRRPRPGGGAPEGAVSRPAGCVDHHLSNAGYAAVNIVDSRSAAACEMLAGLFIDAGLPVDAGTARRSSPAS
jgi:phosphoesterase RecJ-like protein